MLKNKNKPDQDQRNIERRRYQRLDHLFPVEFIFQDAAVRPVSGWYQAFTQDISEGGLCLVVNNVKFGDIKYLADRNITLALHINIPLGAAMVRATGRLAWFKTTKSEPSPQYVLGVNYDQIELEDNRRILRYMAGRRFVKFFAFTFVFLLSAGLVAAGVYTGKLHYENEKLLMSLTQNVVQRRALEEGGASLRLQIEEMKFFYSQGERKIEIFERALRDAVREDKTSVTAVQGSLDLVKKYQGKLGQELAGLEEKKTKLDEDVQTRAKEASLLEKKILGKLYHWLVDHQNSATGLVASFEGDRDVDDWSFTYDSALAAMAFVKSGDYSNARKIFDFYEKVPKEASDGFANAYYASSGNAAEFVVHAGPNIWLALSILQYTHATGDTRYLDIARAIGRWLDTIRDSEGGVKGGKTFSWYSTEHNLDAYAFYTMFFQLTKEEGWNTRAEETLRWLFKNAYSKIASSVVKRGKGDATIATDTFAWSVTAVGPAKLNENGMDPAGIIDFALENCSVAVNYKRPEGTLVCVRGFDFAKHRNLARGGVVSCEWSAQMILALKIMADYHRGLGDEGQGLYYSRLANEYTAELSKMIITSPSPVGQGEFCLPYASHESADTGHGWRTPKGNRTGSVAATAYTILAIDDFNPLKLNM